MGYEISLKLAWDELDKLALQDCTVSLLGENYQVKAGERAVLLQPSGAPAAEMEAVLILHYLIGLLKHGYHPAGEWISFKETPGGKLFWPAFQEGTLKPLVESFQRDPEGLVRDLSGAPGRPEGGGRGCGGRAGHISGGLRPNGLLERGRGASARGDHAL